jgi:hypothetical protein
MRLSGTLKGSRNFGKYKYMWCVKCLVVALLVSLHHDYNISCIHMFSLKKQKTLRVKVLQQTTLQNSLHFVEAKTSCMNERVWIRVQTTHYSKQIVQMLTIGPLTPFSNCFSRHLLKVRTSACWQLRNRQVVLLNLWGRAGIQWDDAS